MNLQPTEPKKYRAFLFDMDGTILNSIAAAERIWAQWARAHGLDVERFLPTIHGVRAIDTVAKQNLSGVDPATEARNITDAEILDVAGVVEIPGAIAFLNSIPAQQWAVVTSAPLALAKARLAEANMPMPHVLITAEDVAFGKPRPDCFILGARRLGVAIRDCLVFEDAPNGILAGEASGADVLVITATHSHPMTTPHPTMVDYRDATVNKSSDANAASWLSLSLTSYRPRS